MGGDDRSLASAMVGERAGAAAEPLKVARTALRLLSALAVLTAGADVDADHAGTFGLRVTRSLRTMGAPKEMERSTMDAPERLGIDFTNGDRKMRVMVSREAVEDDLHVERVTAEEFSDWLEANSERVRLSAEKKLKHEIISGTIFIRSGELLA
ncbi:hypothetical protein CLG96_01960 [Sphingomonas oleivorans]|uniref:Uncharacterized protein n=1 Tax=Sphingomonas oleivorans TaxID=1735121 RepID=A0A2T5G1D6_9SPHN|nr:hypothetical protein [Sphingomonas oleivorans]PTQ12930.1 hypothetical protein CLG96_01960 [Sphingomonas oleivorans]